MMVFGDNRLRESFMETKKFIDDCEYRIPALFKVQPMIEFVKVKMGYRRMIGAEIGVYRGINAYSILDYLPMKKLYLIDPYLDYFGYTDMYMPSQTQDEFDSDYEEARMRLREFDSIKKFVKKKSSEALDDVPSDLDFVFIDGNHTYKYVKEDIELYYDKIKSGGILGGHNFEGKFIGVVFAVADFVRKKKLKVHGLGNNWWIVKGEGI